MHHAKKGGQATLLPTQRPRVYAHGSREREDLLCAPSYTRVSQLPIGWRWWLHSNFFLTLKWWENNRKKAKAGLALICFRHEKASGTIQFSVARNIALMFPACSTYTYIHTVGDNSMWLSPWLWLHVAILTPLVPNRDSFCNLLNITFDGGKSLLAMTMFT